MNILPLYDRVADWNSKRYDREHNIALSQSLLREEYNEWLRAHHNDDLIEQMDGLADVVFVSYGVLWKLDLTIEEISACCQEANTYVENLLEVSPILPTYKIAAICDSLPAYKGHLELGVLAMSISTLCLLQFSNMGFNMDQANRIILAICDSNDTKSIKKTDSSVKANDGDKGTYYKSPTAALMNILGELYDDVH